MPKNQPFDQKTEVGIHNEIEELTLLIKDPLFIWEHYSRTFRKRPAKIQ